MDGGRLCELGLPRSTGLPGGAVLLLRGKPAEVTGEMPAFRYPEILKYKGAPVFVGREDGSAAVVQNLGGGGGGGGKEGGPHLLVGEEGGRVVWYHRADLSTDSVERFAAAEDTGAGTDGGGAATSALKREEALAAVPGTARTLPEAERAAESGVGLAGSCKKSTGDGDGDEEEEEEEEDGDENVGGEGRAKVKRAKKKRQSPGWGAGGGERGGGGDGGEGMGVASVCVVAAGAALVGAAAGSHWRVFSGIMRGRLASRGFATARPMDRAV